MVHVALIHNLTNAPEIRKKLIAAATMQGPEGDKARQEVDFGFIEASLVSFVILYHLGSADQS